MSNIKTEKHPCRKCGKMINIRRSKCAVCRRVNISGIKRSERVRND